MIIVKICKVLFVCRSTIGVCIADESRYFILVANVERVSDVTFLFFFLSGELSIVCMNLVVNVFLNKLYSKIH